MQQKNDDYAERTGKHPVGNLYAINFLNFIYAGWKKAIRVRRRGIRCDGPRRVPEVVHKTEMMPFGLAFIIHHHQQLQRPVDIGRNWKLKQYSLTDVIWTIDELFSRLRFKTDDNEKTVCQCKFSDVIKTKKAGNYDALQLETTRCCIGRSPLYLQSPYQVWSRSTYQFSTYKTSSSRWLIDW